MNNKVFPERLSFCMKRAGLNGTALSDLTGITAASISRYLNGLRSPTMRSIIQFSEVLGVSSDFLLGLSNCPYGNLPIDVCSKAPCGDKCAIRELIGKDSYAKTDWL